MAQSALKSGVRLADKALNFVAPTCRLRPLRDQIIVYPVSLWLSDTLCADWTGEVIRGRVIAAGPGCYPNIHSRGFKDGKPYHTIRQSRVFRPTEVKVGDLVELGGMEIGGYLWPKVWVEGAWCVICQEQDVAVLHE